MNTSERLDEIDFNKIIPIKGEKPKFHIGKVILEASNSSRRVELKSEVKFFLQKYISQEGTLRLFSNDYKNIVKKNIEKMNQDEAILRQCLLSLEDNQTVWMVIDKSIDEFQWNKAKAQMKLETDPDPYIYYKIKIVSIYFQQPAEPKDIDNYSRYVIKFRDEIKYLISKENYLEADKWANSAISRFFTPSKEIKTLFEKNENKKKIILNEFKSIMLNKTLALMKIDRPDKKKDNESIIKVAKEYKKYFQIIDKYYVKMSLREIKCYLTLKNIEMAEQTLKEIENSITDEDIKLEYNNMNNQLIQSKNNSKNLGFRFKFNKKSPATYDYGWDMATKEVDIKRPYDIGILNMLK
jgi:hypothetical protein